jgi:hypothetical protein
MAILSPRERKMQPESPLLWSMLDAMNEACFYKQPVREQQRLAVSRSLGKRLEELVEGMEQHPRQEDHLEGAVLFSGERLKTKFAARHVLLLEGGLALFRFGVGSGEEIALLQRVGRLAGKACFARHCLQGECALATVAWMRWLGAGLSPQAEPGLDHFMGLLVENRNGKGRWLRFPFYYTLLALQEMKHPAAGRERLYAREACQRVLAGGEKGAQQERRRRDLLQRIVGEDIPGM